MIESARRDDRRRGGGVSAGAMPTILMGRVTAARVHPTKPTARTASTFPETPMAYEPRAGEETGAGLLRGVALIVAAGIALGLGFNAMQRSAGSERGLSWIRHDVKLASLEDLPPDPGAMRAADEPLVEVPQADPGMTAPDPATPAPGQAADAPSRKGVPGAARAPATGARPAASAPPASAAAASDSGRAGPPASPAGLPVIPESNQPLEIQYPTAKKFHDAGAAVFVDARSRAEYEEGHIPGAFHLDFDDVFETPDLAAKFDSRGKPIITYCGGGECELSRNLAFALIEGGHHRVLVFTGGTAVWTAEGQPLVTGTPPGEALP